MRWRKAFILTNRNAKFYFVAVDLEGEVNGFLREVMTNVQQQSPKRVGEPSSFKFQNFASLVILIIVAENNCCKRSWKRFCRLWQRQKLIFMIIEGKEVGN